jgi:short-subunit dehydrogenase
MHLTTAVITGAGQGIGRAAARELASHGLNVCLVGRTRAKLDAAAADIRAGGGHAGVFAADLTHAAALDELRAHLTAAQHPVDVLVHCIGEALIMPVADTTWADFNRILSVNLGSAFLAVHDLLPFLRQSANPSIVLVSSKVALRGYPGVTAYSAAKAGVVGFARSLAAELRQERIRVAAFCPGPVDTPMRWAATPDFPRDWVISAETVAGFIWQVANLPRGTMTGDILLQSELYD